MQAVVLKGQAGRRVWTLAGDLVAGTVCSKRR